MPSTNIHAGSVWTSRTTGKNFKVSQVSDDGSQVTYFQVGRPGAEWTRPCHVFLARFAPVGAGEAGEADGPGVGLLVAPDHRHDFEKLILYPEAREQLLVGLSQILKRDELERVWKLSELEPRRRCVLNFHGPPGTGKTLTALAIAKRLGKQVYQVDYSKIISKWAGDTAKLLVEAFREARKYDAVLMFDEADSLASHRANLSGDDLMYGGTSINQNRNVFMQELDRHDGVVLMCTNLFHNFDQAFLRRIAGHVAYRLPNFDMRVDLFKRHLPATDRVKVADLAKPARACRNFSGGDIFNVVVNAINRASLPDDPADWVLTDRELMVEIERVSETKRQHRSVVDPRYLPQS